LHDKHLTPIALENGSISLGWPQVAIPINPWIRLNNWCWLTRIRLVLMVCDCIHAKYLGLTSGIRL